MTASTSSVSGFARFHYMRSAALVVALLSGLTAGSARATMPVLDAVAIAKSHADSVIQVGKLIEQHAMLVQQLAQQVRQYEQMFVTLTNFRNIVPRFDNDFPTLDASGIAEMQCQGSAGTVLGGLMDALTSSIRSPYVEAQRKICEQIVAIEVKQYNTTAEMLNRLNDYSGFAQRLEAMRDALSRLSKGDLDAISNQASRNMSSLDTEVSNWQSQVKAYDEMLKRLQAMQSTLANTALNGHPTLLGTSIQAAALAAALHVAE